MKDTNNRRLEDSFLEFELASRLEDRRVRAGLSRETVAAKVGVTAMCIWKWEQGYNRPCTLSRYESWARAVGASFKVTLEVPA